LGEEGEGMTRFVGIDPSTKTGFVALDENGQVVRAKELTGVSDQDPKRMVTLIHEVIQHVQKDDIICIEGFSYNSTGQGEDFQYGLGHGIRNSLYLRQLKPTEVAPNAVKKFVGVTGWIGEKGSKQRLTGKDKKKAVMKAVMEHYRFTHTSDNIVDAFILAQIAYELHVEKQDVRFHVCAFTSYKAINPK
jgi:crossover junction endodeoxyribonuclease RuvC